MGKDTADVAADAIIGDCEAANKISMCCCKDAYIYEKSLFFPHCFCYGFVQIIAIPVLWKKNFVNFRFLKSNELSRIPEPALAPLWRRSWRRGGRGGGSARRRRS